MRLPWPPPLWTWLIQSFLPQAFQVLSGSTHPTLLLLASYMCFCLDTWKTVHKDGPSGVGWTQRSLRLLSLECNCTVIQCLSTITFAYWKNHPLSSDYSETPLHTTCLLQGDVAGMPNMTAWGYSKLPGAQLPLTSLERNSASTVTVEQGFRLSYLILVPPHPVSPESEVVRSSAEG